MRTVRRRGLWLLSPVVGLSLCVTGLPAAEQQDWDGGSMTKWVTPDFAKKRVKITVTYKKKPEQIGQEVRFIEMIGPKTWAYNQRVLIPGHGTIPAGQNEGKVEWDISEADVPNLRQGSVIGCFSCHGEQPPTLDEWPGNFNQVTPAEFDAWALGIRNDGYEQYIDIATGTEGSFKTRCFQSAEPAKEDIEVDFFFAHLNRGPAGSYALAIETASIPATWELSTDPPLGTPYFLANGQLLYAGITITPHDPVDEGDQAVVTLCTIDQDTGECPETFRVRVVADTQPPQVTAGPDVTLVDQPGGPVARVSLTATDGPASVASARLLYSLDGAPQDSLFMSIDSFDADPVSFLAEVGPLGTGTHTLTWRVQVRDELKNVLETPEQTTELQVARHFDVIHSRIPGHPTAQVPGAPGAEFTNIFRTFGSPSGSHWIFKGFANAPAAQNDVIVVGSGVTSELLAKEGASSPVAGTTYGPLDLFASVNDSGQAAFSARLTGAPIASDEAVFTGNAQSASLVVREGDPAPGLTDDPPSAAGNELFGNLLDSPQIQANGTVGFSADGIQNAASSFNSALYLGSLPLAQEGTPVGGGGTYSVFFAFGGTNYALNSNGDWVTVVDIDPSPVSQTAVVVNGVTEVSAGDSLPGLADPILAFNAPTITGSGDWIAQGITTNFDGFVLNNSAVVAVAGDPVEPGGTELFVDPVTPTPPTFFAATSNDQGHVLVGANTTHPNPDQNQVLALVDNRVLARKGDPVDLNDNGIVSDDDAKIGSFATNSAFISVDASVYFTATLQTLAGSSLGDGLLRGTSECFVDSDCDDQLFCTGFEQCVGGACRSSGNPCAANQACVEALDQCLPAIAGDADLDGDVDYADFREFVGHFGQPASSDSASSDFNGDGSVNLEDFIELQDNFGQSY